jgi:signal transduction histidine kinase/predicted CoA-binding protein
MYEFLKNVSLFTGLQDEDLTRLCEMISVVHLPAGSILFNEGSPGDQAYIVQEGQVEIYKTVNGRSVLLALIEPGEVIGEMSLLEAAPRSASGRTRTDSTLLAIRYEQLDDLLNSSSSAARAILNTITARLRSNELVLRQSEKLAQLSTLTAGIAHELNNPSAAVRRSADLLQGEITRLQQAHLQLNQPPLSKDQIRSLSSLGQLARERALRPEPLDALERSDLQYMIESRLETEGIENAWELAPTLASIGLRNEQVDRLSAHFSGMQLGAALTWISATYVIFSLLEEICQGAGRISEIVMALKTYVYMDQSPVQSLDVQASLEHVLKLMEENLPPEVTLKREYTPDLPTVQASRSELEQVWAHLVDNAIDAVAGEGTIIVRTYIDNYWLVVEVQDDGPGIPEAIQERIFSPFFTTKPVGKGAGLGLNMSYNIIQKHAGEIKFFSRPEKTVFQVRLPVDLEAVKQGKAHLAAVTDISDQMLYSILENAHNIAVVGITNNSSQPSGSVPMHLKSNGFRIYPVNPNLTKFMGEKTYASLTAITDPIDIVLVFRRSEFVPEIVAQAIQIGAKAVWMQEGIVNEVAAAMARNAGIQVVMDTCIRTTHKRLFLNRS